ncbi:hypothetical protein GGH12_001624 [Coemansia sp. RSA 1822]|nr:hypothetical protein LPJ76_001725 [Coemansia sp. RSA 638]KAJ2122492.1 hypothetical protein IW147_003360 [Coemansia sp. RSA 720]KAJ2565083.1 hypothetical protein GGH12_001624 [Coemansia sp. RSA 1822]
MVRVLYFASARDLTEKEYDDVDIAKTFKGSNTVPLTTLLDYIERLYVGKKIFQSALFAVNDEYRDRTSDVDVKNSDEVVVIPPVSGG